MLKQLATLLQTEIRDELIQQGHKATGNLIDSVKVHATDFQIIGESIFYGEYVERGRKAKEKRVPIDALIQWIEDKNFSVANDAEKKSIAFAIQAKIYKEGIPTKNSMKYSKNGRRQKYLSTVLDNNKDKIRTYINNYVSDKIDIILTNYSKTVGVTEITVF